MKTPLQHENERQATAIASNGIVEAARHVRSRWPSRRLMRFFARPTFGALIGTVLVYVFFVITAGTHKFTGLSGTATWMDNAAEIGIAAIPVALLMISGEFDLSIGSVIGASTLTLAAGTGYFHLALWMSASRLRRRESRPTALLRGRGWAGHTLHRVPSRERIESHRHRH